MIVRLARETSRMMPRGVFAKLELTVSLRDDPGSWQHTITTHGADGFVAALGQWVTRVRFRN